MVLPTLRVAPSLSFVKPFWKLTHRHKQMFVFSAILNPIKLTIKSHARRR